jgi:hypothetical protein
MIRLLTFLILYVAPQLIYAQHRPQIVDLKVDTVEIFIEGPVFKKLGIFYHVRMGNWDDLSHIPLVKTPIDILVNASEEWVSVGKAEIYRLNEKDKTVEIKLLEDLKPPKGLSNWSLDSKANLRLRWKEILE